MMHQQHFLYIEYKLISLYALEWILYGTYKTILDVPIYLISLPHHSPCGLNFWSSYLYFNPFGDFKMSA